MSDFNPLKDSTQLRTIEVRQPCLYKVLDYSVAGLNISEKKSNLIPKRDSNLSQSRMSVFKRMSSYHSNQSAKGPNSTPKIL